MGKILNAIWILGELLLLLYIYGGTIFSIRNVFYPVVEYNPSFVMYIVPILLLFTSIFLTYVYFNHIMVIKVKFK